jgi:peptidoglycan-associated lipoprotein
MKKLTLLVLLVVSGVLAGCACPPPKSQPVAVEQPKVEPAPTLVPAPSAAPAPTQDSLLTNRNIYYDFDSSALKDEYKAIITAHAKNLTDNPSLKVTIQGNCDERGSREYNLALGQRRADSVKRMMIMLGAKESQIETVSFGREKPRASGHNEEAWAENRRSDIVYQDE